MKGNTVFAIISPAVLLIFAVSINVFAKNSINAIIPENADGTRKISQERLETVENFIKKEILLGGLNMKVEVPSNWASPAPETVAKKAAESFSITGPRNMDNTYTVNLRIKVYPGKRFDGVEDMMSNISGRTDSKDITISGKTAKEVLSESRVSLPLYSLNNKRTDILTVCAGFEVGRDIVQIKYSADKRDFYEY
ncbi:MAG: hypothetical protein JW728_03495, partial [Candidatus Aureabacteria bacterium]|nr:hypothetical protein [Candidatus Auribacterota bacterium]